MGDLLSEGAAEEAPERAGRAVGRAVGAAGADAGCWALFHLRDIGWMFTEMGGYLGYKFIQRALVVGALVSLCAALLGVSLVLKRYSMIGDGLSHVGFGALTVAMALGFVTADSLPAFLPGDADRHRGAVRVHRPKPAALHAGGGGAVRVPAAPPQRAQPHAGRFRHRADLHLGAGAGRGGHQHDQRHERGRVQLHVRLHTGHERLGRVAVGGYCPRWCWCCSYCSIRAYSP